MGEASKDANDTVNALAVEVEFRENIEDSGPFPGDLEYRKKQMYSRLRAYPQIRHARANSS